jgi:hypothetical protein
MGEICENKTILMKGNMTRSGSEYRSKIRPDNGSGKRMKNSGSYG